MSALALVPPDPAQREPVPPPVFAGPSQPIDWPRRQARIRGIARAGFILGGVVMLACVGALPYAGDGAIFPMVLVGVFVLPGFGLTLLLAALGWHTPEDLKGLLMAFLVLVGGIALSKPISRYAATAWASAHLAELDAIAAERAATLPGIRAKDAEAEFTGPFASTPGGKRLRELGFARPYLVDGGVVFEMKNVMVGGTLLYADPKLDGARRPCSRATYVPLGGRWYVYDCPGGGSVRYEDW